MPQRILDISRVIENGALVYPGDDPLILERPWTIDAHCPINMSRWSGTTHILTHLDAPFHFFPGGFTLDQIPLARFMGEALVCAIEGDCVQVADVPAVEAIAGRNLLFKTRNSRQFDPKHYREDHVYLSAEAARATAERKVNLVGIDYLSVDRFGDNDYPAHRILLGAGVLILEGLDLSAVEPGRYTLIALPLKLAQADGAPTRAVLLREY